jgi:hypothetical protein
MKKHLTKTDKIMVAIMFVVLAGLLMLSCSSKSYCPTYASFEYHKNFKYLKHNPPSKLR